MLFPPDGLSNSAAFMPKTEVMNESGRKMIVTIVKSMMERPWMTLSSARSKESFASMMEACCCLRVRRSRSWNLLGNLQVLIHGKEFKENEVPGQKHWSNAPLNFEVPFSVAECYYTPA